MFKSSLIFNCIGLLAQCVEVDQRLLTGDVLHMLNLETRWITGVTFSPDGSTIAFVVEDEGRNFIHCWNSLSGEVINTLDNLKGKVTSLMLHEDDKTILVASADGRVRTMDAFFAHTSADTEFEGQQDKIDKLRFDDHYSTMGLESSSKSQGIA